MSWRTKHYSDWVFKNPTKLMHHYTTEHNLNGHQQEQLERELDDEIKVKEGSASSVI